ncbi:MAG: TAXI family TRAP transporter solute-binding subunit [Peptococcaceae bacterium]
MKKILSMALCIVLVLTVFVGCSKEEGAKEKIAIAAASPGGGFYMGASALANVINSNIDGLEATVESTGASKHNVQLLEAGEVKLGLSATEVAWEAYNGKYNFDGDPHKKLRTMIAGWPSVYAFVTLEETGIKSLQDFNGKTFSGGPKGSSNEIFTQRVFENLGIELNYLNLPTSDAASALGDGRIDGFAISLPSSAVKELETTHNVRLIALSPEERSAFAQNYPQYVWLSTPAGDLKSAPDGYENFGLYNLFLASTNASEDLVYSIVKAAHENYDIIKDVFPAFEQGMQLENVKYSTIPYHPGAVKYLREKGLELSPELLPE